MGGTTAPFSQWQSPISLTLLGASGVQFESIAVSLLIPHQVQRR